ncbi:MAG: hypothetical protein IT561_09475 [Alphaproteobacteria bacterium]|nr:hypothetical protein [Alphaproteobacteria bacterium]
MAGEAAPTTDRQRQLRRFDTIRNRLWCRADERVLVVRHPDGEPGFHDQFLRWLERNFPALRAHLELALLPCPDVDLARVRLLVPWLQDPVEAWSPAALDQARLLVDRCRARGIPVVNDPARLANAGKRETAERLAAIGIRTPRTLPVDPDRPDAVRAALPGALLVREGRKHGAPSLLVAPDEAVAAVALRGFAEPIAVEFVDTRGPDRLIRKYRCLLAGDHAVAVHLLASRQWEVRGPSKLTTPELLAEEAAHVATDDGNAALFRAARRALDLDLVAFDYGYLPDGRVVVWEANAYPLIRFGPSAPHLAYRDAPVHRSFAAMIGLYLDRAGLPVPRAVDVLRTYGAAETAVELARLVVP